MRHRDGGIRLSSSLGRRVQGHSNLALSSLASPGRVVTEVSVGMSLMRNSDSIIRRYRPGRFERCRSRYGSMSSPLPVALTD